MGVFFSLFANLLPLYAIIGLGYFAGRRLHVDRQSLGALAIYIFMPVVVFGFVAKLDFKFEYVALPIVVFLVSAIVGLSFLKIGKIIYGDSQANLAAMCASMGNMGYFGLPLVFLFFTPEQVAIYVFMMLGGNVYEATIGYYIAARGAFDVRTSLIKIIRFPSIYAISLGIAVNQSGIELPEQFWTYWTHFKGAYVIVGMMIIGAALAKLDRFVFGPRFTALAFSGKFVAWPVLCYLFVALDQQVLGWYAPDIHNLIMMIAIVPPAANIATFAVQMNLEPEKAASTILMGTVFALIYIPFMIWLLGV
jgi:malate permease and related proteins